MHFGRVVDGPDVDVQAVPVGPPDEAGRHHRHGPVADRHLQGVHAAERPARHKAQQRRRAARGPSSTNRALETSPAELGGGTAQLLQHGAAPPVGKAGDQHAVMQAVLLDRRSQGGDGVPVLDVEVEPDLRKRRDELLQPRDRLGAADPWPGRPRPARQLRNPSAAVRDPVQGFIVEEQQDAVGRGVHVRFQVPVSRARRQRGTPPWSFQALRREAAVGNGDEVRRRTAGGKGTGAGGSLPEAYRSPAAAWLQERRPPEPAGLAALHCRSQEQAGKNFDAVAAVQQRAAPAAVEVHPDHRVVVRHGVHDTAGLIPGERRTQTRSPVAQVLPVRVRFHPPRAGCSSLSRMRCLAMISPPSLKRSVTASNL